jgi:predicted nucleotidyltransferase component of viral defense system
LVEKTARALTLLEGLVESKLNFIFKGGTALMLMQQNNPKRLSIDIDIIIPKISNDLLGILVLN